MQETTDPLGRVARCECDDLRRTAAEIRNDAVANSGAPSGRSDQEALDTGDTTRGTGAGDSKIATADVLAEVKYPDPASASDVETDAYDAQGWRIDVKDQAGKVIDESDDASGRLTSRTVSTLPSGSDGAVRRIDTAHDNLEGHRVSRGPCSTSGPTVSAGE